MGQRSWSGHHSWESFASFGLHWDRLLLPEQLVLHLCYWFITPLKTGFTYILFLVWSASHYIVNWRRKKSHFIHLGISPSLALVLSKYSLNAGPLEVNSFSLCQLPWIMGPDKVVLLGQAGSPVLFVSDLFSFPYLYRPTGNILKHLYLPCGGWFSLIAAMENICIFNYSASYECIWVERTRESTFHF